MKIEDVDTYASRILSLAKRTYSDPSERHEPCLNTFLCGIRDVTLYDKVISVPCAEDSFELAVESARKFETMRRSTRNRTREQIDVTESVLLMTTMTLTTGILKPTTVIPTVIGVGSKTDMWTRIEFTKTIHQPVRTTNTNHDEVTIRTEVITDVTLGHVTSVRSKGT